jgi:cytochrome c oxidase subunit 4
MPSGDWAGRWPGVDEAARVAAEGLTPAGLRPSAGFLAAVAGFLAVAAAFLRGAGLRAAGLAPPRRALRRWGRRAGKLLRTSAPSRYQWTPDSLVIAGGLTAVTVGAAFIDMKMLSTPVALGIAAIKALLVMAYFMELRHSAKLTWVIMGNGIFWLTVMIALTMSDMISRGWLGFPGK